MNNFVAAKPVWAEGREKEINLTCVFKTNFSGKEPVQLNLTANCLYRLTINGKFAGYGPARAAHGYFRIDEYTLNNLTDVNELVIEVAGYNTVTFYTLNQPSFLVAEVLRGGKVLSATGVDGFTCYESNRVQKVARFSYQRAFTEYYVDGETNVLPMAIVEGGKYLDRCIPFADMTDLTFDLVEGGECVHNPDKNPWLMDFLYKKKQNIYDVAEFERFPIPSVATYDYIKKTQSNRLTQGQYGVWSYKASETGFIGVRVKANEKSTILVVFDEINTSDDEDAPIGIDFTRNTTYNVIGYEIEAGERDLLSFEAYTAKYIRIIVEKGDVCVDSVYLKTYRNAFITNYTVPYKDEKIALVVDAAARTFGHNAVDIFTDCPSRERAGWLCDGYFIGRAEKFFTGANIVEKNFLENYALCPSKVENIPEGMIPMCYPSDTEIEQFIPNWSLWYIEELYDYYLRTGDADMVALSKGKVEGLLRYFARFENELGLLEDLENWVFIEWSKANDADYICGVNFPSNMLYAHALSCVAKLYPEYSALEEKATKIHATINELSFNGSFYEDNAIREDGKLKLVGHTTETCQYYAFYFGTAEYECRRELLNVLLKDFGPLRNATETYPTVHPSNAFIGNYLRLEILLRLGLTEELKKESVDYFYGMAITTGTLWEHNTKHASLNHGFASYIAVLLDECNVE